MTHGDAPYGVEARDLVKTYRVKGGTGPQIGPVSFKVGAGEFVSLVGSSGCGKTTVMRMIGGLMRASGGTVSVAQEPVTGPIVDAGVVFQAPNLLEWFSVLRNVTLPLDVDKVGARASRRARATELLESVGLGGLEDRMPFELSGGQQQRVALCRALVREPRILLMDEPFGALDALTRESLQADLERIVQTTEMTVVFVTHDVREAVLLSDRVLVMRGPPGRIVRDVCVDLSRPRFGELSETQLVTVDALIDEVRQAIMTTDTDVTGNGRQEPITNGV